MMTIYVLFKPSLYGKYKYTITTVSSSWSFKNWNKHTLSFYIVMNIYVSQYLILD